MPNWQGLHVSRSSCFVNPRGRTADRQDKRAGPGTRDTGTQVPGRVRVLRGWRGHRREAQHMTDGPTIPVQDEKSKMMCIV